MIKGMKQQRGQGFTLVELIIVVTVIAILVAIVTVGLLSYQRQARDNQRTADISVITESLEKYYDLNGEYPSCPAMTASSSTTAATLSIDPGVLKAPSSSATNSFICTSLSSGNSTDQFSYVGDGSSDCQTGSSCLGWTIQYRSEQTGQIVSVSSRRTQALTTSGTVALAATVMSDNQINLSWNTIQNTLSYTVEQSLNSSFSPETTTTTTGVSASMTGLSAGTQYYFRVTPQQTGQAGAPGTANAITTISAPSGTVATAASLQSGNTLAQGAASGGTCPANTTKQYNIGSSARNTNSTVTISYPGWSTATTASVTASQGYNYTFQTQARCVGPNATSSVVTGTSSNITRPISTPSAPAYTGDTSMAAGYRYWVTWTYSCPSGTSGTVQYYDNGFGGNGSNNNGANVYPGGGGTYSAPSTEWWYLGWNNNQTSISYVYYYAFYYCSSYFATSPQSGTTTTPVYVYCEAARQSFSANPRCDNTGQSVSSLPWGP